MYTFLRIAVCIASFFIGWFSIRKSKTRVLKLSGSLVAVAVLLFFALFPAENIFCSFNSPESAFRYRYGEKAEILGVVSGAECDLIVGKQHGRNVLLPLQKKENGWKLGVSHNLYLDSTTICGGGFVTRYIYKGTNDAFLSVICKDSRADISDSYESNFSLINYKTENDFWVYWISLPISAEDYELTINGESIAF